MVKKLIKRYTRLMVLFAVGVRTGIGSSVFATSAYKIYKRSSDRFVPLLGRYIQNVVRRRGISYSDEDKARFMERFKSQTEERAQRLAMYKTLDKEAVIQVVPRKARPGVTILPESIPEQKRVRLLKGLRGYKKQAEFMAQESIHKAVAEENNSKIEGVQDYFYWWTQKDERVRHSHSVLHGKKFKWSELPNGRTGPIRPGQEYGCRCVALTKKP